MSAAGLIGSRLGASFRQPRIRGLLLPHLGTALGKAARPDSFRLRRGLSGSCAQAKPIPLVSMSRSRPPCFTAWLTCASGRVRSEYHTHLPDPRLRQYDPVGCLRSGVAAGGSRLQCRRPSRKSWQYGRVRAALAQYRELSEPYSTLPRPPAKVAPGAYLAARALCSRLVLLGNLQIDVPPLLEGTYSESTKGGVRNFRARHGLDDDGMLDLGTIDAFNVLPAQRVRQLELTLERLNWLPDFGLGLLIQVNLLAYRLWTLHDSSNGAPLEMRVVVGSALKTESSLFAGQMRYVEFNPYWTSSLAFSTRKSCPNSSQPWVRDAKSDGNGADRR